MLLRSSSTPIMNSWVPTSGNGSGSSPEPEALPQLKRARSLSLATSEEGLGRGNSASEPKRSPKIRLPARMKERREPPEIASILLSSSGLGDAMVAEAETWVGKRRVPQTLVSGGGTMGGGIGGICGGGRGSSDGSDPGRWNGRESTEAYYETMIEANPGNPLLLANYAKFLKDVKGDYARAEEYCGRAILANPSDANVLSLYADLIWQTQRDPERAETYYDQAVKADPSDCYVMASYARFLWDVEDDDEEHGDGSKLVEEEAVASAS